MPVPISSSKSQGLLTGLPEPPFIQAHYSIRIEWLEVNNLAVVQSGFSFPD